MNIEEQTANGYPEQDFRHPRYGLNRCPSESDWVDCVWLGTGTKPTLAELAAVPPSATATAEATRLAKRPKRSDLIAQVTAANSATSVAALRAAVIALAAQNVAIMEFISVDIDEDV